MTEPSAMNRAQALMTELRKTQAGRLTVYLGAAPGVGKTCAMLGRAHELSRSGQRVMIGVVETHGRPDTQALCAGLPRIEPRCVDYKGHTLEEFDLQATLALAPDVVLVDELAHSNAPGSLHQFRWQDVDALLKAGIDVHTTLNVQHVESMNDLVLQLTGVRVRETVPDRIFDDLKDIRLIDLPPAELIERLLQGKVYGRDKVDQALHAFFTPTNLSALRELAMELVSRHVDRDAQEKRAANGQDNGPLRKHVLIAVHDMAVAEYLVRAGSRLAERRGATWSAVAVMGRREQFNDRQRAQLDPIANLVRKLGGEFELVIDTDVVSGILQAAQARQALAILIGRGRERRLERLLNWTVSQQLVRRAGQYEVTIVGRGSAHNSPTPAPASALPSGWGSPSDWVFAFFITALAVAMAGAAEQWLGFKDLSAIFLLAVLLVATRTSQVAAVASAVLCFLAYNFFFIDPRFTFEISAEQGVVTVLVFLSAGLLAGRLASQLRLQIDALQAANRYGVVQQQLTQQLATATDLMQVLHVGSKALSRLIEGEVWIRVGNLAETLRPARLKNDKDLHAARLCEESREPCGRFTHTLAGSAWWFIPLHLDGQRGVGVVGILAPSQWRYPPESTRRLLNAMINDIGEAALRACLVNELESARVSSETERLRSALLSSVSHDLRSPLSVMIGAADSLHTFGDALDAHDRSELVDTIRTEGHRLDRYIQNLLDMTRLGHQGLSLKREWVMVEDLIGSACQRLRRYSSTAHFEFDVQPGLPALHVHPALIEQALFNVLENAVKFSPAGVPVQIKARLDEQGMLSLDVSDQGPGIPDDERSKIFDMFYTMQRGDRGSQGTGLGLTIVQGIMGSHMGEVLALPGRGGVGTIVRLRLPVQGDA